MMGDSETEVRAMSKDIGVDTEFTTSTARGQGIPRTQRRPGTGPVRPSSMRRGTAQSRGNSRVRSRVH